MKKTRITLFLLSFLLVSCNKTPNASGNSSSVSQEKTEFIVNAKGRENETYANISTDPLNPSHPVIDGLLFEGWYTAPEGGEKWDFSSAERPSKLYAHWKDFTARNDTEKLDVFLTQLTSWSGKVSHTEGEIEISIQYAIADRVLTGTSGFTTNRYSNNFVQTKNYSPYYAEDDQVVKEEDSGKTAEQVNKENFFSLVEDSYTDGCVYTITEYNKEHADYDSSSNIDGYNKSAKVDIASANNYLDISFASYFLGYPKQLLSSREEGHEFYKASNDETNQDQEGDFYYFNNVNPTIIDPWGKQGGHFEIAYAISDTTSQGYLSTTYYAVDAGIAFKDGKIAHCSVTKLTAMLLNNEAQRIIQTQNYYDFSQGDYEARNYNGPKLDYHNFQQYEE